MIPKSLCAFALTLVVAMPAAASTVGQPFLVIEASEGGAPTGSILDFFSDFGEPTGMQEVTVSGTITEAFGAPSTVGLPFAFTSSERNGVGSLALGATMLEGEPLLIATSGFDPFEGGPGDLNFSFLIEPPFMEVPPFDPFGTFVYGGDFADWPDRDTSNPSVTEPAFEVALSIFLAAPLPIRTYIDPGIIQDPDNPFEIEGIDYIDGPLTISRIEFGTVGGMAVPAPIPAPAGLPLLLGALGALAVARRRLRG